ncbi:MAG: Beta-lactamase class C-like and penicillin binding proteins (PBPs) superfamily [uncultured Acidimicrobiales bacterium]|uniref:Beta-lactamase class C-like and penicillin binding proteins (PBPs) superfamily n=1 Tax=uncultured Acidimicrobiales bacterium TaxID=310071 RepID=A0A6J4I705_9ACTN|nr:MAG: Beta-lactamase class C-like and penicillin binding proteins (PBPs) superfamily [uncultured Acidimicrobiales bacterium]
MTTTNTSASTGTEGATGLGADGGKAVRALFHRQVLADRLHPGAALAVYEQGRLVIDEQVGFADTTTGRPVEADTMFVLFSSTKPLASMSVLRLLEQGKLALDTPVEDLWPGFGQNGKAAVTVGHVLTHRSGFPATPATLRWQDYGDWDKVVTAMEGAAAQYEPGTVSAYHALNHGWVCGEIVRRVDGRDFPQFLREEITGPLGMDDTYVGLPAELEPRVSKLHAMEDVDVAGGGTVRTFNRPEVHQAVVPAGCGIATARDMARFYACMLNGGELDGARILQPETVELATAIAVDDDFDRTLQMNMRRGTGFNLGGLSTGASGADLSGAARMGRSTTASSFGHGGAGTSICWADKDLDVAVVFIPNGYRSSGLAGGPNLMVQRCADISDAVRAACQ